MGITDIAETLTQRDRSCLLWTGMQYALRLDQLQRLLWRYTPEADRYKLKPGTEYLSLDRTYGHIRKWMAYNLIEKKMILHGDKLWVWLSREGLRFCELPFQYGAPASSRLAHLYFINQVRLAVEAKRPGDLWQSERQIRREAHRYTKGEQRQHTPDAILTNATNGKITAIEVEVHAKTDSELEDNLRELAVTYRSIWYFTTSATRHQVETKLATFTPEMQKPFVLYDLADYGKEYGIQ